LDYSETIRLIDSLRGAGVKIVLTAHDLTPHSKQPELYDPLYQAWLGAADGVIHHSQWGLGALRARYQIREQAKHAIIFLLGGRNKRSVVSPAKRARLEAALGLTAVPIRIGIFGTTRRERLVTEFLEGFARTTRDDTQVTCWSLTDQDVVPRDPRIVIPRRTRHVHDRTFRRMLAVCDVIAVPYQVDGEMLTTGFASSAVEAGIGVLRTDWPYLKEVLGDAAIPIGNDVEGFSMALSRLGVDDIERAKRTSSRLRSSHSWRTIAAQYEEFYESVLAE
jgi:glycosyltransferase involved in cell wall biosynthesis